MIWIGPAPHPAKVEVALHRICQKGCPCRPHARGDPDLLHDADKPEMTEQLAEVYAIAGNVNNAWRFRRGLPRRARQKQPELNLRARRAILRRRVPISRPAPPLSRWPAVRRPAIPISRGSTKRRRNSCRKSPGRRCRLSRKTIRTGAPLTAALSFTPCSSASRLPSAGPVH